VTRARQQQRATLECIRPLERSAIGDGSDRPDARHGHEHATGSIPLHERDETTVKRSAFADGSGSSYAPALADSLKTLSYNDFSRSPRKTASISTRMARLQGKPLGVVAGTPPATYLVADGLMANAKPYSLDRRLSGLAGQRADACAIVVERHRRSTHGHHDGRASIGSKLEAAIEHFDSAKSRGYRRSAVGLWRSAARRERSADIRRRGDANQ
jgi:hypothetical protein